MRMLTVLVRSVYLLVALCIAGLLAAALGFVLISSIRHLLWMSAMGASHSSVRLWILTAVATVLTIVFWYRIFAASLRQYRHTSQLGRQLRSRLQPLDIAMPPELRNQAQWYTIHDSRPFAFTAGLWRPRIVLSTGILQQLDENAQLAVLYHEAAHAHMRDPLQQAIFLVLSDALGIFGLRALYHRYLIRREILADREALRASEGDDVPLLCALLAVANAGGTEQSTVEAYVGLTGVMEARMEFLETGVLPQMLDSVVGYRITASFVAVLLTVGQGLLVWCH